MRRSARQQNLAEAASLPVQESIEDPVLPSVITEDEATESEPTGSVSSDENNAVPEDRHDVPESDIAWGQPFVSPHPARWNFEIYEDPPEHAYLSVPTPLGEGFHSEAEDIENAWPQPDFLSDSDESWDDPEEDIDWAEISQRPRDAFGRPLGRDGRPAPEPVPFVIGELSFPGDREVLEPLNRRNHQREEERGQGRR